MFLTRTRAISIHKNIKNPANAHAFCRIFFLIGTALSFKNAERIRKSCYFIALTNGLEIDV